MPLCPNDTAASLLFLSGMAFLTGAEMRRWAGMGSLLRRAAGREAAPITNRSLTVEANYYPNEIAFQSSLLALSAALGEAEKAEDAVDSSVAVEQLQHLTERARRDDSR